MERLESPMRKSLPVPPSIVSLPSPPQIRSSPPSPRMVSLPVLPTITSGPSVPTIVPEPVIVAGVSRHDGGSCADEALLAIRLSAHVSASSSKPFRIIPPVARSLRPAASGPTNLSRMRRRDQRQDANQEYMDRSWKPSDIALAGRDRRPTEELPS